MEIKSPYLLFLGDATDPLSVKTSRGIAQWRPEKCVGELRLEGCEITLGLPALDIDAAVAQGAKTFILGLANAGGRLSDRWIAVVIEALEAGLDVASGLHQKLADIPEIRDRAAALGRQIFDVRHPDVALAVGTGARRSGKRLLTVGTDCSVGKMYATLALEREMRARGLKAKFRATGQTGILITGQGLSVDAVVADFISGAAEYLSPPHEADHWDLIEGQGSLFHPSFAGVSLGLLHGAQADVVVMCHELDRPHMRGLPGYELPGLEEAVALNLKLAARTNPAVRLGGIALNSSAVPEDRARDICDHYAREFGVPCVDPLRFGVAAIVDGLEGDDR